MRIAICRLEGKGLLLLVATCARIAGAIWLEVVDKKPELAERHHVWTTVLGAVL